MANKRLNAVITIGGTVAASLKNAIGSTTSQIGRLGDSVRALNARQKTLSDSIATFGRMGKNVDGLRAQYAAVTVQIDRQRAALQRLRAVEDARQANIARRGQLRAQVFDVIAVGATVAQPIRQAIKFEDAMLGVAKQVDGARDKAGELTPVYFEMGRAIQALGREVPMATNSLAEMVTAGARMGVARDGLIEFTRTAAMMAEAFETEPGQLAEDMGKIAGLYKIPIPAISSLADSINYLDDNAISKGKDIVEYLSRVGGVAGAVKVTGTQMAALGSTLLTLGERTETAGTATNAMFQKFAAADKGTKKFKAAMKEIGLSTVKVQKGMQVDAQGTILQVMDAINKLPKDKQLGVMVELVGLEHSDTLAKLAGNLDEYRKQIALAHSEEAKGSMNREFQSRLKTTSAQLKLAGNRATELSVNLGTVLLPSINAGLGALNPYVTRLADLAQAYPAVTKGIVGTVVGLGALKLGAVVGGYAFTFLKGGALLLAGGLVRLVPVIRSVGLAVAMVGRAMLLNPIGLAVTAIAGSALLIYKYWSPIKQFFGELWGAAKADFDRVGVWMGEKAVQFVGFVGQVKAGFEPIKSYFVSLWEDVKGTFGRAVDWIMGKVAPVFGAVDAIKRGASYVGTKLGFGDAPAAPTQSAQAPSRNPAAGTTPDVPELPRPMMATGRGAGATYTDSSTHTYTIQQQPGQDVKSLADEIERRRKAQAGVQRRSLMFDGVN